MMQHEVCHGGPTTKAWGMTCGRSQRCKRATDQGTLPQFRIVLLWVLVEPWSNWSILGVLIAGANHRREQEKRGCDPLDVGG
jgi:hypothetical protein